MNVIMPQPGETVAESQIVTWLRTKGDLVAKGDPLFEIETDKATMEIPALVAGRLSAILVDAGVTVPVGTVVAVIDDASEAVGNTGAMPTEHLAVGTGADPAKPPRSSPGQHFVNTPERNFGQARLADGRAVTPLARRLAHQAGVDLQALNGSGPRGTIKAIDVSAAAAGERPAATSAASVSHDLQRLAAASASAATIREMYQSVGFEERAVDGMRAAVARRLTASKTEIPHFYLTMPVDFSKLLALRAELNRQTGQRISINDWVVKAYALALKSNPTANAVWAGDTILQLSRVDVSVAVSLDNGLLTPVVRDAGAKSLSAISSEIMDLAERARSGALKSAEMQGGSGTVSNLGMHGVASFAAIINPPQATILAVGAVQRRQVEVPDGVAFSDQATLTLSVDHRVIDGVLGAAVLGKIKNLIETPIAVIA